jgi:N-acetylneuraminic acid mutarotase
VLKTEAWVLGGRRGNEPQSLKLVKEGDALVAELTAEQRMSPVALRHTYGVLSRGGESFLLKYYAKSYPLSLPGTWRALNDAELLPLEVVPVSEGNELALKVLWQGKPQSGALVTVEGAGIEKKLEGTTDDAGTFRCKLTESGMFSIRARHTEAAKGELEGKAYDSVRHYSTLALRYQPAQLKTAANEWPAFPKGVTSFGGAVAGDYVYLYGGHFGDAHHYWKDGQSGELLRLKVDGGKEWEQLASGPRRTGTALVAHGNKLYRIGGFEARNKEGDEADLHSMADVGRFDPATGKWEDFAAMPTPRSSHDAAVLDSILYVVGGWNLQAASDGEFHDTMLTLDLSAAKPEWKSSTVPFKRRALSVAAHNGKLYAIGGMQEKGGPATTVDVYDPKSQSWSSAPALHGEGMEGFGNTSFEIAGRLTAITRSGAIQQLWADGKSWEISGYLKHPRFFARLLPIANDRGIVIAGADMSSGKVNATEIIGAADVKTASQE